MERYKRLTNHSIMSSNNFYSLDLYSGKTNLPDSRGFYCFFIVDHPCSEEFIHDQALQVANIHNFPEMVLCTVPNFLFFLINKRNEHK